MDLCPVTGETPCPCDNHHPVTPLGNAMRMDLKAVLRKLFTDHAVYTNWLILVSLPILQRDADETTERLLRNPVDIANLLLPIIGLETATVVEQVIRNHLVLANEALTAVRSGDKNSINTAVAKFYEQGKHFGEALSSLNPAKLGLDYSKKMVRRHNEFVVQLATLRSEGSFRDYINIYDKYYKHMLMFSDMIYETTTA